MTVASSRMPAGAGEPADDGLVGGAGPVVLLPYAGGIVPRAQYERETNYLRVYFAQIRRKLEPDPARPRYFITEARMGYRFTGN